MASNNKSVKVFGILVKNLKKKEVNSNVVGKEKS